MTKMFKPKINNKTPAPPPPTPKIEPPKREIGGEDDQKASLRKKRKGRSALRIDPQTGGVPNGGQGLNIPMK